MLALSLVLSMTVMCAPRASAAKTIYAADIVSQAKALSGKYPYVSGGESPNEGGFDCTGLIYYIYHTKLGYEMTLTQARSKSKLAALGTKITNKADLLPGDIVQYTIAHIGIYIGGNTVIHSGVTYGVSRVSINSSALTFSYGIRLTNVAQGSALVQEHSVHTKGAFLYSDEAHPHYNWYLCPECGAKFTDRTSGTNNACITCNPISDTQWREWSDWSSAAVSATATRQVETRQVKVSDAYTEYRYGNYANAGHDVWCVDYGSTLYSGTWTENYTPWSTTRKYYTGHNAFCANGVYHPHSAGRDPNGWAYWYIYSDDGKFTGWNKTYWYWEETRTVPAGYRTEYRYRDMISVGQKGNEPQDVIKKYFEIAGKSADNETTGAALWDQFAYYMGDDIQVYGKKLERYNLVSWIMASKEMPWDMLPEYGRWVRDAEFRGHTPASDYAEYKIKAVFQDGTTVAYTFMLCKYGSEWTLMYVDEPNTDFMINQFSYR